MQRVDIEDVEPQSMGESDVDRRGLSDALGTTDFAINYYALDPGEAFAGGLHTHLDQEEVFYVVEGTATFETKDEATAETETVEVGPDEAVRFARGEFQQGRNESDERVVALALGAPEQSTDVRIPQPCRECDSDVLAVVMTDQGMSLECPDCGATVET
ncbi:cupin domain-containing protein [Halomicrococcus gelatinilyticus]|uniref:cupin domain-containing protein n=1 Tax=Halomicrococcus gelatinilyticus TaxID=1702103 RepID=UPI002E162850